MAAREVVAREHRFAGQFEAPLSSTKQPGTGRSPRSRVTPATRAGAESTLDKPSPPQLQCRIAAWKPRSRALTRMSPNT